MKLAIAAAALVLAAGPALAAEKAPACAADARTHAEALLKLHFGDEGVAQSIGDEVKALPPIAALKGKGQFDVLEVYGYIYKAEYRMRFVYAQIPGECVLMGQEILEASDPY